MMGRNRLLRRRLVQQTALAQFGGAALRATAIEPLRAEAAALVRRVRPSQPSAVLDPRAGGDDDEVAFAATVADMVAVVSERLVAAEASHHAALHDPLTGLANRSLILDHLGIALGRAARRSTLVAVVFLDLDDFKQINDTLGHAAGDEVLRGTAARLGPAIRPGDTLGRWGGDEFVLICEDLEGVSAASSIVQRVAAAFDRPLAVHGEELNVAASIGVAVSGGPDDGPTSLIEAADVAMYHSKRRERPDGEMPLRSPLPSGKRSARSASAGTAVGNHPPSRVTPPPRSRLPVTPSRSPVSSPPTAGSKCVWRWRLSSATDVHGGADEDLGRQAARSDDRSSSGAANGPDVAD